MADVSLFDVPYNIALALSLASSSTGADYDYLLKTAQRESAFQADARAGTSSAQGLFQFIEETWIRTVKEDGPRFGLSDYADRIAVTAAGKYTVPNAADRTAILALRNDPHISAMMAGVYARRNADYLASEIGRRPTSGELYIAHFLGPSEAAKLIALRNQSPDLVAPDLFPRAADANRSIFYDNGRARSVGEVYDRLIRRPGTQAIAAAAGGSSVGLGPWETKVQQVLLSSIGSAPVFGQYWAKGNPDAIDPSENASNLQFAEVGAADAGNWDATVSVGSNGAGSQKPQLKAAARSASAPAMARQLAFALRGSVADTAELLAANKADSPPKVPALAEPPRLKMIRITSK